MQRIKLMINGMPGDMAATAAKHTLNDKRFELIPYSLTGPEITENEYLLDGVTVRLIHLNEREQLIEEIKHTQGNFITADYTHPSAVSGNAEFYCKKHLPFVMGTTGGDRKFIENTVKASATAAVIAPNMSKQIVGFQAMLEYAANTFPGLFEGYSLEVKESHQKGKADTSGTAKAIVQYFNKLGTPFSENEIRKERDPDVQRDVWGVPAAYLKGHGWHTYTLISGDGTVKFEFKHNVNGRDVYAKGTLDAVLYLSQKINQGAKSTVYSMIDVLKRT